MDKCLHQGLMKLAEALQYYWPASLAMAKGQPASYLNEIGENNIALQLARSFGDQGFQVYGEIPIAGRADDEPERRRFDFLAYQYELQLLVALELKNTLEQPQENIKDFYKLADLAKKGICDERHEFNYSGGQVNDCPNKFYGLVSIIIDQHLADWWMNPQNNGYQPIERSESYIPLGQIL